MSAARYDLGARLRAVTIPRGVAGAPHHLAALALFLAAVEGTTGAMLSAHYLPSADAYGAVRTLVAEVPYGDLIRAVHARGADLLVATAWLLVLAAALLGRHRRPRELAWCALVLLAFVTFYEAFTGSVLPWSRDGAAGAQVATATVGTIPVIGPWLRRAMLGGDAGGAVTLVRVWGAHAAMLPGVASVLLGAAFAHRVALREPPDGDVPAMPLAPHFALRAGALCTAAAIALVLLAVFAPPGLGAPAQDPPVGGAAPWYLGSVHAALTALPPRVLGAPSGAVAVLLGTTFAGVLLALPWIDPRGSRHVRALVFLLALAVLGGTVYARLR